MFWLGLAVGLFTGSTVGVLAMGALQAGAISDRERDRLRDG